MSVPRTLLILVAMLATPIESAFAQTPAASDCPITPPVAGYPTSGPQGDIDWYANAVRTIWVTFAGWDFVRRGSDQPDPKTGYSPGWKVLWYKPASPLIVTGRRTDGAAPPLVYDISIDPRPRGTMQPSRLYFPTAGCWEIDAKAGEEELRLVVLVKPGPPTFR
jgi:hypothetical protein